MPVLTIIRDFEYVSTNVQQYDHVAHEIYLPMYMQARSDN